MNTVVPSSFVVHRYDGTGRKLSGFYCKSHCTLSPLTDHPNNQNLFVTSHFAPKTFLFEVFRLKSDCVSSFVLRTIICSGRHQLLQNCFKNTNICTQKVHKLSADSIIKAFLIYLCFCTFRRLCHVDYNYQLRHVDLG